MYRFNFEILDTYTLKRILKNTLERLAERKRNKMVGDERYFSSEIGFFTQMWHSLKKRCNQNSNYYKNSNRTPTINFWHGVPHILLLFFCNRQVS